MYWNAQPDTFVKAWGDTQKQMWDSWYTMFQSTPAPFPNGLGQQWHDMMKTGMESWLSTADPTIKETAQRFVAGQEMSMKFVEFLLNSWQNIAAKIESGQDWQQMLTEYTKQLHQQLLQSPESLFQVSQNATQLWQLYLTELQKMSQPWVKAMQNSPAFSPNGTGEHQMFNELLNLYWGAYEKTFGTLLQQPSFGLTREINDKILKAVNAQNDLQRAGADYQLIIIKAWTKAFEQLIKELATLAQKGKPITSLRELIRFWHDVADPVFIEIFNSDDYIRTQGYFVNALMTYRLRQRDVTELWLQINDMPTRAEVDEAHRHIYEQRKAVNTLKKELAEANQTITDLREEVHMLAEAVTRLSTRKRRSRKKSTSSEATETIIDVTPVLTENPES